MKGIKSSMRTFANAVKSNRRWPGGATRARGVGVGNVAVGHDDDEGPRLTVGEEVVHDQPRVPLAAPAGFVLAAAVLQIQHRITPGRIPVIIRRGVNEAAEDGIGAASRNRGSAGVGRAAHS
jgi:hypothetical protein